mmetsp:Transcript_37209/g.84288  ORF Transcript_37209/g.84288 Transcript_37209/m.84288 type:complete len:226 (-) Transcript_37209:598-1275(-)
MARSHTAQRGDFLQSDRVTHTRRLRGGKQDVDPRGRKKAAPIMRRSSSILQKRGDLERVDCGGVPHAIDEIECGDHLSNDAGVLVCPGLARVGGVEGKQRGGEATGLCGASCPVLRLRDHLGGHEGRTVLTLVLERKRLAVSGHVHASSGGGGAVLGEPLANRHTGRLVDAVDVVKVEVALVGDHRGPGLTSINRLPQLRGVATHVVFRHRDTTNSAEAGGPGLA